MHHNPLLTPLDQLKGVGKYLSMKLAMHNLHCVRDLLLLKPKRILHSTLRLVAECAHREEVAITAHVQSVSRTKRSVIVHCADAVGARIDVMAMSTTSWTAQLAAGSVWVVQGVIDTKTYKHPTMIHPTWSKVHQEYSLVYPTIGNISHSRIASFIQQAVQLTLALGDPVVSALHQMHKCHDPARLEWLIGQVGLSESRVYQEEIRVVQVGCARKIGSGDVSACVAKLGYALTADQTVAISEVLRDMDSTRPMCRLLQGDVGSGKTAVLLVTAEHVTQSGGCVVLMAPTGVLAHQHYATACRVVSCPVYLLTGKSKASERRAALESTEPCLVIGTHALIHAKLPDSVALAIIDEQHKFGVQQRLRLRRDGVHVLSVSATPIPRSLQLTALGYLSTSVLRHKPAGRAPIKTYLKPIGSIADVYQWVQHVLDARLLVYWVCPRIVDDPKIEMSNIQHRCAELEVRFPGLVGVMHGRSADKESLLEEFRSGRKPIMLSTTVIEVGIDVPEAKGIVIEQAEQYGLAQLHQLRGRVGRGQIPGDCILIYKDGIAWYAKRRLKVMQDHQDGFVIAEQDKQIRGYGDVLGHMQSGMISTFRFFEPEVMDDHTQYAPPTEIERILWGKDGGLMYAA